MDPNIGRAEDGVSPVYTPEHNIHVGDVVKVGSRWEARPKSGDPSKHGTKIAAAHWLVLVSEGVVTAELNRRAERLAKWLNMRRTAARMILSAPPLIGTDTDNPSRCSESWVYWGSKARFDVSAQWLMGGAEPEIVRRLLHCEGAAGPERMIAAWWYNLGVDFMCPTNPAEKLPVLFQPATDLVQLGALRPDVLHILDGTGDRFRQDRLDYRHSMEGFAAEIAGLAGMAGNE